MKSAKIQPLDVAVAVTKLVRRMRPNAAVSQYTMPSASPLATVAMIVDKSVLVFSKTMAFLSERDSITVYCVDPMGLAGDTAGLTLPGELWGVDPEQESATADIMMEALAAVVIASHGLGEETDFGVGEEGE